MNTLQAAVASRDEAAKAVDELTKQLFALERAIATVSPAVRALADIRAQDVAAMEAWSAAGGEGKLPSTDHLAIAKLESEIQSHNTSVASARAALQTVIARREAAKARHAAAEKNVQILAILALIEEEDPKLIYEIEAAKQKFLDLDATRSLLRKFLSAQADAIKSPSGNILNRRNHL
jgi:hypothetical protein